MSPKKEVSSLKYLAIKAFESTLECAFNELMTLDNESVHHDFFSSNEGFYWLKTKMIQMGKQIFDSLPYFLINCMVECVIQLMKKLDQDDDGILFKYYNWNDWMIKLSVKKKIILLFSAILLQPQVTSIDISIFPLHIKQLFHDDLDKMSGLKILTLSDGSYLCKVHNREQNILKGLTCMPHLVEFHLKIVCNDEIIKCISRNCKQLEVLRIPYSKGVTEFSVPYITQMKHLKDINLTSTKIEEKGYLTLLCELPMLENIDFGDFTCKVLINYTSHMSMLRSKSQNMEDQKLKCVLNLKHLKCSYLHSITVNTITELCPALVTLELYGEYEIEEDISSLMQLKNLISLKLLYGHIEKMKLISYLESYHKLANLYLQGMHYGIDMVCLMYISDNCPRLKTFEITRCTFSSFNEPETCLNDKKYFTQLKSLICDDSCQSPYLDFILKSCYAINTLHLISHELLSDVDIERIISHNPMALLNELKISDSHLSIRSLYFLIENCPSLRVIQKLGRWHQISQSEINSLKKYIQDNNLDLTFK